MEFLWLFLRHHFKGNQWWCQEVWSVSQAITYTLRLNETIQCFCRSVSVTWMECDRVCCAQSRSKRANRNMWQRSPLCFITVTLWKINDSVRFFGPWVPDHVITILWHYIYLWQTAVIVKVRCTLMF